MLQSILLLAVLSILPAGGCLNPPAGLTGWLRFDEPTVQQKSMHAPEVIAGRVGRALRFDGKGQYFELPAGTKGWDPGTGDFTVELWVRTSDTTHTVNVVDKRSHDPW